MPVNKKKGKAVRHTSANRVQNQTSFILILAASIIILIALGFSGISLYQNKFSDKKIAPIENLKVDYKETSELPSSFPSNFPVYPGSTVSSSWTNEGDQSVGMSVIWETKDSLDEVSKFYKDKLVQSGWTITSEFPNQGSYTIAFKNSNDIEGFMGISQEDLTTISATLGINR